MYDQKDPHGTQQQKPQENLQPGKKKKLSYHSGSNQVEGVRRAKPSDII